LTLQNVIELDWWEEADLGEGRRVTCVPAQHFSARTPFDRNRTLWAGFVLRTADQTIYFAGDSGYGPHFQEIGRRCPSIDVALLPIGAYEPRWFMRSVHMNPEDAVVAYQAVANATHSAPPCLTLHWGAFRLTDEAVDEPPAQFALAWTDAGLPAELNWTFALGETRRF
jgi:L-ascorbate metabolism protein UlaG (beta-lactamase superfamily)